MVGEVVEEVFFVVCEQELREVHGAEGKYFHLSNGERERFCKGDAKQGACTGDVLFGEVFREVFEGGEGFGAELYFVQDEEGCSREYGVSSEETEFCQDAVRVEVGPEDGVQGRGFFEVEVGGISEVVAAELPEDPGFAGLPDATEEERFSVRAVFPGL